MAGRVRTTGAGGGPGDERVAPSPRPFLYSTALDGLRGVAVVLVEAPFRYRRRAGQPPAAPVAVPVGALAVEPAITPATGS